jgi:DNA topoisomerase I
MTSDGVAFDYLAKEGKRRAITITDQAVGQTVRALTDSGSTAEALFCYWAGGTWQPLRSHEVSSYIARHAGGHFTAKEFRTWNATVLMALLLANAGPSPAARGRMKAVTAGVRGVADWLGDTSAVARSSYIDPRLISYYQSSGQLPTIPRCPAVLPAAPEAESAIAALLTNAD